MPKASDAAWMQKLMVSLSRKWRFQRTHTPLKQQLSINRGKALGLPKYPPNTRYQRKIAERRRQKWLRSMKAPF